MKLMKWMLACAVLLGALGCSGEVELSADDDKAHEEYLKNGIDMSKQGAAPAAPPSAPTNEPTG